MALIVTTSDGETIPLPPELALDDEEWGVEVPGLDSPDLHGAWPLSAFGTGRPRQLRASAVLEGVDRSDVEATAEWLRGVLLGRGPLHLRREDGDAYITVEAREVRVNPYRGRFLGRLCGLSIEFEALDPWWYATAEQEGVKTITASPAEWTVDNPGADPAQPVVLTVTCLADSAVNPRIENLTGGWVAAYAGTLVAGQTLTLDTATRDARVGTVNAWSAMNVEWQAQGFRLVPGPNVLRYTDGGGARQVTIALRWRPRFY